MPNSLKIERNKIKVLEVEIEDKIFKIPLGTSLKRKELEKLSNDAEAQKFFEQHIGKELWNDLTVGEQRQISQAWSDATQEDSGVKPGES